MERFTESFLQLFDYTQMCGPCGYLEVPSISILELLLLVFLYLNNGMYVIS